MDNEPEAEAFLLNSLLGGGSQRELGGEQSSPRLDDEFMKQLKGSGAANALTIGLMFLFWVLRNKCKHSRCTWHSLCCTLEVNDESEEETDLERDECREFSRETQEKMFKLFKSKYPSVFSKHQTVISTD